MGRIGEALVWQGSGEAKANYKLSFSKTVVFLLGSLSMEEDRWADSNEGLKVEGDGFVIRDCSKFHNLKRTVQFLVSVCVFSLVMAFSFSLFSLFPHSFSVYFSTFLFSLFTHAMERKYMFLVCNGILFILATCSLDSESSDHLVGEYHSVSDLSTATAIDVSSEEEEQKQETATEEVSESTASSLQLKTGSSMEENYEVSRLTDEVEEEEEDEGCFTDEVEVEDEEEEGKGSEEVIASTEELNKKIEEFIRKMKEEMRIEAQTQLIAV